MKCILLAAGYATRLWPLTKDRPKGLLNVAGKPVIEYIIEKMEEIEDVDEIYIVINDKFYSNFKQWANEFNSEVSIKIVNDHTTSDDDKLGAIGDLNFALENEDINDDFLVTCSDTIFQFSLKPIYEYFKEVGENMVTIYDVESKQDAKKGLIVELDEDNKIIDCEEKPEEPKTTLYSMTLYFFTQGTREKIKQYLDEGNNPDAPGHFPEWLHNKEDVYAYEVKGKTLDTGNPKDLEKTKQILAREKDF